MFRQNFRKECRMANKTNKGSESSTPRSVQHHDVVAENAYVAGARAFIALVTPSVPVAGKAEAKASKGVKK
jgi:hypothetical protein